MGPADEEIHSERQWLAFEINRTRYALPIDSILEIEEPGREARCIPGVSMGMVAVVNWHGSALPVVASDLLVASESEWATFEAAMLPDIPTRWSEAHVLVLSERDDEMPRLGLPVDRVLGLLDTSPIDCAQDRFDQGSYGDGEVAPRGLCPNELWNRATRLVERACA